MPQCDPRARGSPNARKPLNRPALRGGVIQPGAHLTPGFYPAQKSNLWIALGGPGPHSATAAHRGADAAFHKLDGYVCHLAAREGHNGAHRGRHGGERAEGRSEAERPSALP